MAAGSLAAGDGVTIAAQTIAGTLRGLVITRKLLFGHADNLSGTFGGVSGLKYKFLQLDRGGLSSGAQCFEVFTAAPVFLPGTVSDTRLWIVSHLGSWTTPRGLNDDRDGTLFSAARVYLRCAQLLRQPGLPGGGNDLEEIWLYTVSQWSLEQAEKYTYTAPFEKSMRLLPENPYLGKTRPDVKKGYRALHVEKHLIFYHVSGEYIDEVGIPHIRMDAKSQLKDVTCAKI